MVNQRRNQAVPWDTFASTDPRSRLYRYTQGWALTHPITYLWVSILRLRRGVKA